LTSFGRKWAPPGDAPNPQQLGRHNARLILRKIKCRANSFFLAIRTGTLYLSGFRRIAIGSAARGTSKSDPSTP
jgi:hypothetical protein